MIFETLRSDHAAQLLKTFHWWVTSCTLNKIQTLSRYQHDLLLPLLLFPCHCLTLTQRLKDSLSLHFQFLQRAFYYICGSGLRRFLI